MRLPIPIISSSDTVYTATEIERPESGAIVNAHNIIENTGNSYSALLSWLSSCVISISSEENEIINKTEINGMIKKMAYSSAELFSIKAVLMINEDDEVEGVYKCPRCDTEIIAERKVEDGVEIFNTADYISNLAIKYKEDEGNTFTHEFEIPVEFKQGMPGTKDGQPIEVVNSIVFHYPTLADCISAYEETGGRDKPRLQFRIYSKAIEKVNGQDVNDKWKRNFGIPLFNKMKGVREDLIEIYRKGNEYGLDPNVEKRCPRCDKSWQEPINSMNFFGSALQSIL